MRAGFARAIALGLSLASAGGFAPVRAQESAPRPAVPETSDRAVIERARVLKRAEYPEELEGSRRSGNVVVRLLVTANGELVSVRAVSGPSELRAAATTAVRNWEFNSSRDPDNLAGFVVFKFTRDNHYADIVGLRDQEIALASEDEQPPPRATDQQPSQQPAPAADRPRTAEQPKGDARREAKREAAPKQDAKQEAKRAQPAKSDEPAAAPGEPVRVPTGELLKKAQSKPTPRYPAAAANARVTGTVVVEVLVDERGKVVEANAVSGPMMLREAAITAARDWTFKPSTSNGKAVKIRSTLIFMFRR
jgi:TonB family protein